jgi:ATP-dependent RNA helicase DHX57
VVEEGGRRKEEGRRRKEEGGRRKEEGGRRKEEGGRRKEEGGRRREEGGRRRKEGKEEGEKRELTSQELYVEEYSTIDWYAQRNNVYKEDDYKGNNWLQKFAFGTCSGKKDFFYFSFVSF